MCFTTYKCSNLCAFEHSCLLDSIITYRHVGDLTAHFWHLVSDIYHHSVTPSKCDIVINPKIDVKKWSENFKRSLTFERFLQVMLLILRALSWAYPDPWARDKTVFMTSLCTGLFAVRRTGHFQCGGVCAACNGTAVRSDNPISYLSRLYLSWLLLFMTNFRCSSRSSLELRANPKINSPVRVVCTCAGLRCVDHKACPALAY